MNSTTDDGSSCIWVICTFYTLTIRTSAVRRVIFFYTRDWAVLQHLSVSQVCLQKQSRLTQQTQHTADDTIRVITVIFSIIYWSYYCVFLSRWRSVPRCVGSVHFYVWEESLSVGQRRVHGPGTVADVEGKSRIETDIPKQNKQKTPWRHRTDQPIKPKVILQAFQKVQLKINLLPHSPALKENVWGASGGQQLKKTHESNKTMTHLNE